MNNFMETMFVRKLNKR